MALARTMGCIHYDLNHALEGYRVTIQSESKETLAKLGIYIPHIINQLLEGTALHKLMPVISQLTSCKPYTLSLSDGVMCHLDKGNLNSFIHEIQEVIKDEAVLRERSYSGYHKGF